MNGGGNMGYTHVSQAINSRGVEADITWGTGTTVTVTITGNAGYGAQSGWQIRGQNPDTTIYCSGDQYDTEGSFDATDGKTYYFQAVWGSVSDGAGFTVNFDDDSGSGDNGDGWEDDSGGSGGGSSSYSSIYPESGTQNGVTATFTISGSTVTVTVSSTSLSWRINGTNSGGDHGTYYIGENRNSSGSFTAEDNHTYAFQVCSSSGYWSDGAFFTVNLGSGEDVGGGGGDSGTGSGDENIPNDSLKEYNFTALGVKAKATYTSGPEVTITILSWSGYDSIPYWRIKGVKSEGDDNIYLGQNNKSSNSFNSDGGYEDGGKNYIFQVCKDGNWNNDGGDASKFHVDFSIDNSGSGGSGGESSSPVTLYVNQGEGTKVKVIRTWSNNSNHYYANTGGIMYENGVMHDNVIWYDGDFFEIAVEAEEGYELDYYNLDEDMIPFSVSNLEWFTAGEYISDKRYKLIFDSDVIITTTATPIATAHIYNKDSSNWDKYALYIYSVDSGWSRYAPYVYSESTSSWGRYS